MTAENPEPDEKPTPPKKRGPRKESEIREEMEAEVRAKVEAEVRAEYEERERLAAEERKKAEEARPISSNQIDGDPTVDGSITVHFVEDGLTLLGKVWYRGEELTINPGTDKWERAHAVLTMDEFEQEERWGRRFFRPGTWRGKRYDEIDDPDITPEEREQLRKAQEIRDKRYGALNA